MRIGVNALYLIPGGVGGTEIYLRSLLAALARVDRSNDYVVFVNRETGAGLAPEAPNFRTVETGVRAVNRPARLLWEQFRLPSAIRRERLDVLFNPGFTAPARCRCPSVTVFHDLQHKRHPEYFRWFDLPFWNWFLWQSARTSKALIAVSQATAADLERYYPGTGCRITVVRHGVDEKLCETARRRDPELFLLCVSTLHPHKNLERLIRAFAGFHRKHPRFRLVLAGMKGFHTAAVTRAVEDRGLAGVVELTGWISREAVRDLYRRAWAFVLPTTFEGFGMPLLEALAAGVPSACSDIPPLREVAGDAALRFPPDDEAAIEEALERITTDDALRSRLAAAGRQRAARFSWERCARETLAVLRRAAGHV